MPIFSLVYSFLIESCCSAILRFEHQGLVGGETLSTCNGTPITPLPLCRSEEPPNAAEINAEDPPITTTDEPSKTSEEEGEAPKEAEGVESMET